MSGRGTSSRAVRIGISEVSTLTQEDTQLMKPAAGLGTVEVMADGAGLVSPAGVALLVELAGRVGLGEALSGGVSVGCRCSSCNDHVEHRCDLADRAFGEGAGGPATTNWDTGFTRWTATWTSAGGRSIATMLDWVTESCRYLGLRHVACDYR
jgi:hypothetical protein